MRNFGRLSYGSSRYVSGTCTDWTGLLGTPGAKVSCADLKTAQEGKPQGYYVPYTPPADDSIGSEIADYLDDTFGITEKPPAEIPMVAYGLVFGILGLGAYTLYTTYQNRGS